MEQEQTTAQEPRPERVGVMLTASEKAAVRFVAAHREVTESDLVRTTDIATIVAEHDRIRTHLAALESEVAA